MSSNLSKVHENSKQRTLEGIIFTPGQGAAENHLHGP
jgi:hypothetical protein